MGFEMLSEMEIWRSAAAMIKRYGKDAGSESARHAHELLVTGDTNGAATWRRIVAAVEKIQAMTPGEEEKQH